MTRGTSAALLVVAVTGLAACRQASSPAGDDATAPPAVAASPSEGCRAGGGFPGLDGERRRLAVDGEERAYLIDAPASPTDTALPLVLVFHGFRHDAAGLRSGSGFAGLAAGGQLIAVHPDGRAGVELLGTTGRGWDTGPDDHRDVAFVRALLDQIERDRCVDRRRIFATGFSNGAFLANLLGCELADRLAAIAAVSGARALDGCAPAAPMPVLFFHGTADRVVPPGLTAAARGWWRVVNHCDPADDPPRDGCVAAHGCAADVVYCEGPLAHTWPRNATSRMWRFFQSHPRR
jgi:polyhydroxybutyrate depolymerase